MRDYEKEDLFIEMQSCIEKLNYMLNSTIERYGFDREEITSPEEAMEFIKYLSSAEVNTEFAKSYSTIPIHSTAADIDEYFKTGPFAVYMEMAEEPDKYVFAQSPNTYQAYSEWHNSVDQSIQKYLAGSITADDFLSYADEFWTKAYQDEGAKW